MKSVALEAFPRTSKKRNAMKKLRNSGRIPAVLYGRGRESSDVEIDTKEFELLVKQATSEVLLVALKGADPTLRELVVLHELAHAYHDQVLSFDNKAVVEAYENIKGNGSYEKVLLYTGAKVKHYGLSNHKEYFAESTEAYFGVNDFYPFVRAELKEHDPKMYSLLEKIWGPVR